ncbi:RNA polymerase sigma-70 factor, ECF subfamily [Mariniphaga anaerophila]|uniref:RNA polymerase sigma-70 factor, ECF subfamily n=1 Tax=Mariniphaga anaerophila TaxID=1484053 RepID=A0A1M4VD29_9BACT|nr:RNA polymerase sigma-70 factor [Mariniphaga anaerophila]SHE66807.1 RNA polymerase sigma-70 factor, ECF subfamily [Mariniphaga anaerophila]
MSTLSGEIIELVHSKQEAAFEVMFSVYYPRLVYFAKEYVPYEDAKSLVQDAFITFWEKNPDVSTESQLQSYLYTIVKNNCLMRLRHEKIEKGYVNEAELRIQNQVYSSALQQLDTSEIAFQEIETIIEKTLSDLPPRCREVFVLSRLEGKKNHEVAQELNISVKAVEAQITKALKVFRIELRDFLPILAYLLSTKL